MSYQVLARKWRPGNFEELVGQSQVSQALINALESQRLHHAYLFTGTRGVGKTTIARILSKSLNCEKGITSTPCGECASCVEISQGNFVDLLEIDAASKTKVEDTRELLENVQYRPTRGRYKVYLIDEVHMLSGHSFNALLKTLEEPPPHVVFLLATTDPQKLPVTVLSRCLQFHLRRMEESEISSHLNKILLAENIDFEPAALGPITKGADGSMRDALSLLDQAIAFCGDKIVESNVLEMLGSIDRAYAFELLEAIRQENAELLIQVIERISGFAPDYDELLADWLSLLHQISVDQATNANNDSKISELASQISPADLQLFYQLSLQARRDLAFAPHPRQGFEMSMLRILAFKPKKLNSPSTPPSKKKVNLEQPQSIDNNDISSRTDLIGSSSVLASNNIAANNIRSNTFETSMSNGQPSLQTAQSPQIGSVTEPVASHTMKPELKVVVDNVIKAEEPTIDLTQLEKDKLNTNTFKASSLKEKILDNANLSSNDISTNSIKTSGNGEEVEGKPEAYEIHDSNSIETNYIKIDINEIDQNNWFNVVGSLSITGHGLQILLNSLGVFESNCLSVKFLEKVQILLTPNAQLNIEAAIRQYFKQEKLRIEFVTVESSSGETPKERQSRLFESAIEQAQQRLLNDPQIKYLIEHLGAKLPRESVQIKK